MSLIDRIFKKNEVDCPRCLGKGNVDLDDIKRLKKELKWLPGECAYCDGTGKTTSSTLSKITADNTYLTIDISREERKRLFDNDPETLERALNFDIDLENFIKQVEYLYFVGNLSLKIIVDFYLISSSQLDKKNTEIEDLTDYVERIIENRKINNT